MKALFVAYQDVATRLWAPVGRLTRQDGRYHFAYTQGAKSFPNFVPFGRMTDLDAEYVSDKLFPLFANRVLPKSRPEYADYMRWLGLSQASHDALEELARTGGLRATDTLELIPCPTPTEGRYEVFFFCRGLRHLSQDSQTRALALVPGERLYLAQDIQNSSDESALFVRTGDPVTVVGYAPRYYSADFTKLMKLVGPGEVHVQVERVNPEAPIQYRVLCKLTAPWPADFAPCETGLFQPLILGQDVAGIRQEIH